jgi:hypothetical protein
MTERVRITHPRTDAVRSIARRPPVREIEEQTELGDLYMASLIRSQRRLAITVCGAVALLLGGTALVAGYSRRFGAIDVLGVPLPWLVLGAFVYPALIGLGWYAVHNAERTERDFLELVRRR